MKKFNEATKHNFEKLQLFMPIVERVHGRSHPEIYEVHKLFNEINAKIKEAGSGKPVNLDKEFKQLRVITHNHRVPGDVCESYEAVYKMLAEIDKAYQS